MQAAVLVDMRRGVTMLDPLTISLLTAADNERFPDIVLRPFKPDIHESIDVISVNAPPLSSAARLFLADLKQSLFGDQ